MTITVIGHGYVGLVTATVFANLGNTVWVIGRTPYKIEALRQGKPPFFEPGLKEIVRRNIDGGRLFFTLDYDEAIPRSDIIFICVGTPPQNDGRADLHSVFAVAKQIGKHMDKYKVVVTKSTVPPGTNRKVETIITNALRKRKKKTTFSIASCPEFLREGSAISDTLSPDRIVIGTESNRAKKLLLDLHKPIDGKTVLTSVETAEMIKYVANAILSTKISFANAVAFLCDKVGADVNKVMQGVGLDRRIGRSFLYPGVGYGGSCFPKDVKALIAFAEEIGYDFKLLKEVDRINKQAIDKFIKKVLRLMKVKNKVNKPLSRKTIGILGLAFKPNTDDMREAPSVGIIERLKRMGAEIRAYDPEAQDNAEKILQNVFFVSDAYGAAKNVDCLLIITEWNEFHQIDLERVKKLMKTPLIVDGRNIYDPLKMIKMGFTYEGVGRSWFNA